MRSYLVTPVRKLASPDKNFPNIQVILSSMTSVAWANSGSTSRVGTAVGISKFKASAIRKLRVLHCLSIADRQGVLLSPWRLLSVGLAIRDASMLLNESGNRLLNLLFPGKIEASFVLHLMALRFGKQHYRGRWHRSGQFFRFGDSVWSINSY